MAGEADGFSPLVQLTIYAGGVAASILAALIGGRRKRETAGERADRMDADRIAAIEEELAKGRERESNRIEREHTERELLEMRRQMEDNLQQIIKSIRESFDLQIKEINRQLVGLRQQIGRLSRKQPK